MKKRIHVNKHVIASNRKHGKDDPAITVKTYKSNRHVRSVEILGPSRVIHNATNPLSCGAVVWIETDSGVRLDTGETL